MDRIRVIKIIYITEVFFIILDCIHDFTKLINNNQLNNIFLDYVKKKK